MQRLRAMCSNWQVRSLAALDEAGVMRLMEMISNSMSIDVVQNETDVEITQGSWKKDIRLPALALYDEETGLIDFSGGVYERNEVSM